MRTISNLFGSSPFVALQEHMNRVMVAVKLIRPLFEALADEDTEKCKEITAQINEAEHEADKVKNAFRNNLPKGLFLPVPRRDLLDLMHRMDGMADRVQDVAEILSMRKAVIHPKMKKELFKMIDRVVETSELACEIISKLDELMAVSFTGGEAKKVLAMIDKLNMAEHKADVAGKAVAMKVFKLEGKLDPVSIWMWSNILTRLGSVANRAENTGNHLRLMIASN